VWENTGEKCSVQSEELPLHRVLDLSILICSSLDHFQEAYRHDDDEMNSERLRTLAKILKDMGY